MFMMSYKVGSCDYVILVVMAFSKDLVSFWFRNYNLPSSEFPVDGKIKWKAEYPQTYYGDRMLHLCLVSGTSSVHVYYNVHVEYYVSRSLKSSSYSGTTFMKRDQFVKLRAPCKQNEGQNSTYLEPKTFIELCVLNSTPLVEVPVESTLVSALSSTLDSEKGLNNVKLYFGQEKEPMEVSKFMLMTRSPVFKTMFQSDFKEAKDHVVKIPDISP